ncbi:hypothetical protein Cgig2_025497 [Carnegiea gigantea]|uniref:Uncharacterized protein n=1 Tax=Carnegiea gigantea TaxID=171969 RepID=A0A9Q1GUI3_9CARY|nr:hypothetical protein Cgig2_025497 [Carnegiea gigantea]
MQDGCSGLAYLVISPLAIACALNTVLAHLTAFSPSYYIYTLLLLLTGFSTSGVGLCAFVLATEPIGPSKCGVAGMSTFYFFSSGIALLSGISYVFQSWRALHIALSIPSILFISTIIPFLSESPRWYMVRGKIKEAMKIMRSIAECNARHPLEGVELVLDDDLNNNNGDIQTLKVNEARGAIDGSFIDAIKSPVIRIRLVLTVWINFCCSIVYHGLSLNVVNLKTSLYLNLLLNAITEMPTFTLTAIMLDRFRRNPLTVGTMWFSRDFCLFGA